MANSLASFIDIDDVPELVTVDRSTLERYADCPARARFIEAGRCVEQSNIMASGNEVHAALSATTAQHITSRGALSASELAEELAAELRGSRPDVQPDAIAGCRSSVWAWAKFIGSIHPENILHFDGGESLGKSGQLAVDLTDLRIRATSEVDLLYSGPSPVVLHEVDYKAGHKKYTVADVADSFQFQMHAWLVLSNYTEVECLEVRVWETRHARCSYPVAFQRRDMPAWAARIRHAAGLYVQHMHDEPEEAPAWPTVEKCDGCPAALVCKASRRQGGKPEEMVDTLVALDARRAEIAKLLDGEVQRRGAEIVSAAGNAYGYDKPKRVTKPKCAVYQVGKESEGEDGAVPA